LDQDLAAWAIANPLPAIALFGTIAGALTGLIIAAGKAARPIAEAIRAWKDRRNGNGQDVQRATKGGDGPLTLEMFRAHEREDGEHHGAIDKRMDLFENLTNKGQRLEAHFKQGHDHANLLMVHEGELKQGGRRITALEGEVKGLRSDFSEHRGEVCARLDGLDTGQQRILAELQAALRPKT